MILVYWPGALGRTVARLFDSYTAIPGRYLRPEWGSTVIELAWPGSTFLVEDARTLLCG